MRQPATQDKATMMNQLFESALGVKRPGTCKHLTLMPLSVNSPLPWTSSRVAGLPMQVGGEHPAHDTRIKRLRHLNLFQHECLLDSTTGRRLTGLYRMRKTGRYGFLRFFI